MLLCVLAACALAAFAVAGCVTGTVRPSADCDAGVAVIGLDAVSSAHTVANAATLSWTHATGASSNRVLVVGVAVRSNSDVLSVAYGGLPLSRIRLDIETFGGATSDARSELWYLVNPAAGANTVMVTTAFATSINAGATTWGNVDPTTPLGTNAGTTSGFGPATSASLLVSSAPGELVVDVVSLQSSNPSLTVGAAQVQQWQELGPYAVAGGSSAPGATTLTMTWTFSSDYYAASAVALRPGCL